MSNPSRGKRADRYPGSVRRLLPTIRLTVLAAAAGVLTGLACWAFLWGLDRATTARLDHPWLVWLLPVVGLLVGAAYHHLGGRAGQGNGLLLDEIHQPTDWVPRRMAPMVAIGTVASHLVGASVGREGTALQMSGSLTDLLARTVRLGPRDRRVLLVAALGGGFGAMFGVPFAGTVFGLEVQRASWLHEVGGERSRFARLLHHAIPTATAAFVGHAVVLALWEHPEARPHVHPGLGIGLLTRVLLLGLAFGLAAAAFIEATDLVKRLARSVSWPPLRPAIGGCLVLALVAVAGRDYLGLSIPLIEHGLSGDHLALSVPAWKLAFTTVCIGTGFIGGEVTPLFVIGTTLGAALAPSLGLDPVVGAELGFVAVFAGAANTPLACTVMAVEIFGTGILGPAALACGAAYLVSGQRGIYPTQRRRTADGTATVDEVARWWPRARPPRRPTPST